MTTRATPRFGLLAGFVEAGGAFSVVGGCRDDTFTPTGAADDAERCDASLEEWKMLPPMPTARHGLRSALVDDRIFVISGGPEPGFTFGTGNERLTP